MNFGGLILVIIGFFLCFKDWDERWCGVSNNNFNLWFDYVNINEVIKID